MSASRVRRLLAATASRLSAANVTRPSESVAKKKPSGNAVLKSSRPQPQRQLAGKRKPGAWKRHSVARQNVPLTLRHSSGSMIWM